MSERPEPAPELRLSATVLLLRDGTPGLEVFMVQRHHQIDFVAGALVFPGGKVEPSDAGAVMRAHCDGTDGLSDDEVTVRVAAIRETFEESGVLLARPRGESRVVNDTELSHLDATHRAALQAGECDLRSVVEQEQLTLACDELVPFAHWLTPTFMPKRFDTHFFLAAAPPDQLAAHDGHESVDSLWTTVPGAVESERAGTHTIIFPTLVNLRKLGRSADLASAMRAARQDTLVTVLPEIRRDADGDKKLFIPEDAGYDVVKTSLGGVKPAR